MDKRLIYRNILLEKQFSNLVENCRRTGVQLCPLKGMGLLLTGRYRKGERDMEDIDILIKKEDEQKIERILRKNNYYPVKSGEKGYYRKGEPAIIDIHTDILYMNREQLERLWNKMASQETLTFLPDEEHFIYILFHAFVQHGYLRNSWAEDLRRLLKEISQPEILEAKAQKYGLEELLTIYDSQVFWGKREGFKTGYTKFILSLPHFSEKGHFLRPIYAGNLREKLIFIKKFLFPSLEFLKRRYNFRPAEFLYYCRPFLLMVKMIKAPLK
ncbi:MAG: nucleotidyltransferase family protein [Elusimicrobiota bacterium]